MSNEPQLEWKNCIPTLSKTARQKGPSEKGKKEKQERITFLSLYRNVQYKTKRNAKPTQNTACAHLSPHLIHKTKTKSRNLSEVSPWVILQRVKELAVVVGLVCWELCVPGFVVTVPEYLPESSEGGSKHDAEASPRQAQESGLYSVRKRRRQCISRSERGRR